VENKKANDKQQIQLMLI